MFLIVGGIILYSTTHCFMPANRMMASLHLAARNFQTDFKRKGDYLWDDYKDNPKLFGNKLADTRFREYCEERRRLTMLERSAQCDIDDYLNEYYIDSVMKWIDQHCSRRNDRSWYFGYFYRSVVWSSEF